MCLFRMTLQHTIAIFTCTKVLDSFNYSAMVLDCMDRILYSIYDYGHIERKFYLITVLSHYYVMIELNKCLSS